MKHLSRCMVAGIVALLPVAGTVLTVVWLERSIADALFPPGSTYFPGLGLLAAAALVYGIGLCVTTFVGKWLWARIDRMLARLPALGQLYRTLKQILGYGEGKDALFERVVLVPSRDTDGVQLGLLTATLAGEGDGNVRYVVFVPGSPNPTTGRLIMVDSASIRPAGISVHEALKALVSAGKTDLGGLRGPVAGTTAGSDVRPAP